MTEFTGYTCEGDELLEWHDDEISQHGVQIKREWRGLDDIFFYFGMRDEAHATFMALCQIEKVVVGDEEVEPEDNGDPAPLYPPEQEARRQFIDDTVDDANYNAHLLEITTPRAGEY